MTEVHKVGPKGQVVIPKRVREELGIEPGDDVSFQMSEGGVVVRPTREERPLFGRFRDSEPSLIEVLAEERAAERQRDEQRGIT